MKEIRREDAVIALLEAIGWSGYSEITVDRPDHSPRVLASLIRRASGILGQAREYQLVDYVFWPLVMILGPDRRPDESIREHIQRVIEYLLGIGDLVAVTEVIGGRRKTFIYPGEPRFVQRKNGDILVIGILPEHNEPVTGELGKQLDYRGYLRFLPGCLYEQLKEADSLREIPFDMWMEIPLGIDDPRTYYKKIVQRLEQADPYNGDLNLQRWYRSDEPPKNKNAHRYRWKDDMPKSAKGFCIVNFTDTFGVRYWAFAKVDAGEIERCVFLPTDPGALGGKFEAADEARMIQLSMDCYREKKQIAKVNPDASGGGLVKVYAPLPGWVDRRWSVLGEKLPNPQPRNNHDCLFAYRFGPTELETELEFAKAKVWLSVEYEQDC
ncbi:hypothetical protein FIM07_03480 [SAR202 cluster bacterium AD-802-F09_MRT_200m]|nr:hypothetical protein [SAR202 cluster bacterium AD-802-F09_MRT_200m]